MAAYCHDPESEYNEGAGVMASVTTALRDPFFFRWHSFIDSVFTRHKDTLTPYTNDELKYNNVHVTKVEFIFNETKANTTENANILTKDRCQYFQWIRFSKTWTTLCTFYTF